MRKFHTPFEKQLTSFLPNKMYFTLKECCEYKGINYKTICNRKELQPNKGKGSTNVGGRKVFRRDIVIDWLFLKVRNYLSTIYFNQYLEIYHIPKIRSILS